MPNEESKDWMEDDFDTGSLTGNPEEVSLRQKVEKRWKDLSSTRSNIPTVAPGPATRSLDAVNHSPVIVFRGASSNAGVPARRGLTVEARTSPRVSERGNLWYEYVAGGLVLPAGLDTEVVVGGVTVNFGPLTKSRKGNPSRSGSASLVIDGQPHLVKAYAAMAAKGVWLRILIARAAGSASVHRAHQDHLTVPVASSPPRQEDATSRMPTVALSVERPQPCQQQGPTHRTAWIVLAVLVASACALCWRLWGA